LLRYRGSNTAPKAIDPNQRLDITKPGYAKEETDQQGRILRHDWKNASQSVLEDKRPENHDKDKDKNRVR
jgi:hypothetical protein